MLVAENSDEENIDTELISETYNLIEKRVPCDICSHTKNCKTSNRTAFYYRGTCVMGT